LDEAADRLLEALAGTLAGRPSKAEALGHCEVAVPIRGVTF